MPQSTKIGYQGKISAGLLTADTELDTVRDVTINLEANEVDDTSRITDGWRSRLQGLNQWGLTFEMIYDPTNVAWALIRDAFLNHNSLEIEALDIDPATIPSGENAEGLTGTVFVTGFEKGEPLEEAQTSSITLVGGSKPTWVQEAGTLP